MIVVSVMTQKTVQDNTTVIRDRRRKKKIQAKLNTPEKIAEHKKFMQEREEDLPNFQRFVMPMSPEDPCTTLDGSHIWYLDSAGKKYCCACALRPIESDELIDERARVACVTFADKSSPEERKKSATDSLEERNKSATDSLEERKKSAMDSPEERKKSVTDRPILPSHHPLDDVEDISQSPVHREGRRIAIRQDRHRAVALKFSQSEYDTVRRVARHLGYSIAQTMRLVMKEKEQSIWPDKNDLPHASELDSDKRAVKLAAKKSANKLKQRRANAFQAREAYVNKQIKLNEEKLEKKKEKYLKLISERDEILRIRANKRAGTRKMYREIDAQNLRAHKIEKESFKDVEKELAKEVVRLGRPLTESEKWAIGNRVRASVGNEEDLKIEAKVARVVLDKERKIKRKLTEREYWEVRDAVRNS